MRCKSQDRREAAGRRRASPVVVKDEDEDADEGAETLRYCSGRQGRQP